ncbi:tRNA (N(6)-L-threonylcarbamoyladenosine(37)-C(2))-methylthiotransferase MtaB [Parabacteroides sp. AM08-6]|uniref:tRNA (N(6)-L-threonylcarbamoyladenosine(37)-C(2))- methylthiotransferase MtaB n=1 Tax=Parabacteroides sp. AM08-6 TaxID=2292053 RepID=UPI000EFFF877|nr:tRNA (N(6)-L-threonylcarbamoyladenosine(37)-C(2))-methylthiotransferase MtaB [Parabacteroides sp. AM08-6]RHJ84330.1 tRNA (N(6)-L-threonylcarbamoyladenosine(37)-C(2))-methylthiotransferase MtaB [Parabacteroides sp. AM08-6]
MIDKTVFENKIAAYYTLGCKLNFAETSTIGKVLAEQGVRKARTGERADICVVNTCSVTELADKKCRQAIRRIGKQHPGAFIVVTGCYAQLKPEEVSHIEGVDLVLGAEQKLDILTYLDNLKKKEEGGGAVIASPTKDIRTFSPSCSADDRTRHFLKVQDGCDYFCSYCTIPFARGRSRNGTIASMVKQAQEVAAKGGKEIVLTGVNIGDFGKSTGETFIDLIRALDEVEGILRYRISSIEPNLITDEAIDFVAGSKRFAPHFHIPLQSGSDEVLKLMRRRYDTALFRHKIEKIKEIMPHAFIGVDVIVGTRGETDEWFEAARSFIESLDISQLHVFSYSERPGTQALKIAHVVDAKTKHLRSQQLLDISERKLHAFYEAHIGNEADVLFEHTKKGGMMHGFTENYIKVEIPYDSSLVNETRRVVLGGWNEDKTALLTTNHHVE